MAASVPSEGCKTPHILLAFRLPSKTDFRCGM